MTTKLPGFPQEGGCLCGDVRYSLLEDPIGLHACHCVNCQTRTGSAFGMTMVVQDKSAEILQGKLKLYSFTTRDGLAKRTRCCPNCATCVWGEIGDTGLIALQPGTLDDTAWLEPIAHIFTSHAQTWVETPTGVLEYERQPEDELELVRTWRRRNRG
ncbi:MAG: GFA family protein [Longimicrobiales bacterium]